MKTVDLSKYGRQKDPFFFALETVLLEDLKEDLFFIWHVFGAVIIGKNQLIDTEVNQTYVKKENIDVFRRLSGGGAVYSDEGCIKYSFLSKTHNKDQLFKEALIKIKSVFDSMNIEVTVSGRNDILYGEKKFSGNAFYRNEHGSCLHGTILYDTDFEKLVKSITPSNDKLISKGIESVRQRVVNMKTIINEPIDLFEKRIECTLTDGVYTLSASQEKRVFEKMKEFSLNAFIEGFNPPYQFVNKKRFDAGTIGIKVDVKKGLIEDMVIYGDFFSLGDIEAIRQLLLLTPFDLISIKDRLSTIKIDTYIIGLKNDEFYDLFKEGLDGYKEDVSL